MPVRNRLGVGRGSGFGTLASRSALAGLLAVMVLFNTGVVAAVALGGTAPSNVPLQQTFVTSDDPDLRSEAYQKTDLDMYVWLVDHRNPSLPVYGDWITINQHNDWYNPQISAAADRSGSYDTIQRRNMLLRLTDPYDRPGYVMLGGHNTALGVIATKTDTAPLATVGPELSARDKIYTTGHSAVYLSEN